VASVQFSRTVERRYAGRRGACADAIFFSRLRSPAAGAGLSKLNSMLASSCKRRGALRVDAQGSTAHTQPARFGRHARPNRSSTVRSFPLTKSRRPAGRCGWGTVVLPRKEVIQPQLPLRLPCSRRPPCRHGAWTISSSSPLSAEPGFEQTALPRVPRTSWWPEHQKHWSRGARRVVSEGSAKAPGWAPPRLPC
jgi:hypothetical protein